MSNEKSALQGHFDRLVLLLQRDLQTMSRARWWWKSVGSLLAVISVTAPILVASGLIANEDLKKIALLAATLSSALYALFSPNHLALARRLDVADGLSSLRRLMLDWDLASDDEARLKVLKKAGGEFDRRFRQRAFTLFEGMQKQDAARPEPPPDDAPEAVDPAATPAAPATPAPATPAPATDR